MIEGSAGLGEFIFAYATSLADEFEESDWSNLIDKM
jgi:hypothetical protein